jgi:hypothetical protein
MFRTLAARLLLNQILERRNADDWKELEKINTINSI